MSASVSIPFNRGSDLIAAGVLTDASGAVVDITGWTFSVVETIPASLADNVTCVVQNGPTGAFLLTLPWSAEWPTGEGNKVSIRLRPSNLSAAFPEIVVNLQ